jgi:hypothetical protein
MPELGTSGSVRGRDGQPPGLLDRVFSREAFCRVAATRSSKVLQRQVVLLRNTAKVTLCL